MYQSKNIKHKQPSYKINFKANYIITYVKMKKMFLTFRKNVRIYMKCQCKELSSKK